MRARSTAVVVGASVAGVSTVRALREQGFDGRVVLVGDEAHLPYDRPPLSKAFLLGTVDPQQLTLTDDAELEALEVDSRLGTPATGLRPGQRTVLLGEQELVADLLILATGARPRALPGPGWPGLATAPGRAGTPGGVHAPSGVHLLRTLDDALALRRALHSGARLVVVGAGFIGSEVASAARALGLEVTVVETAPVPLSVPLGAQMGAVCADLHAANGVELRCGVGVAGLRGAHRVTGVELDDGTVLHADLVVVGVGAGPATDWLAGSGLAIDNGVLTDERGLTCLPGVAAVGDVARPASPWTARPTRVEHWTNAWESPTRAVAALLAGTGAAAAPVPAPYYWSEQYRVMIQFAGHREPGDPVEIVEGDRESGSFVAVYRHGDRASAVIAMNAGRSFTRLRRRLQPRHVVAGA